MASLPAGPLPRRGGRLTAIFVIMVAVGLAATATWSYFQQPTDGPMAGEQAPAFTVQTLDGSDLTLNDLTEAGQPVVISLWATWCTACEEQAAELRAFSGGSSVPVAAIAVRDDLADVEAHWDGEASNVVVAVDESGSMAEAYQAVGLPVTYVISPDGTVLHQVGGLVQAPTLERLVGG
ncbi:MAG TPA: redoxin domain-containing protein [Acidimicrobiia bacterium]